MHVHKQKTRGQTLESFVQLVTISTTQFDHFFVVVGPLMDFLLLGQSWLSPSRLGLLPRGSLGAPLCSFGTDFQSHFCQDPGRLPEIDRLLCHLIVPSYQYSFAFTLV